MFKLVVVRNNLLEMYEGNHTVRANWRTVVSISACRFARPTGWAIAEDTSRAPAAIEEVNFIFDNWLEEVGEA